jgi:hypothetical protein
VSRRRWWAKRKEWAGGEFRSGGTSIPIRAEHHAGADPGRSRMPIAIFWEGPISTQSRNDRRVPRLAPVAPHSANRRRHQVPEPDLPPATIPRLTIINYPLDRSTRRTLAGLFVFALRRFKPSITWPFAPCSLGGSTQSSIGSYAVVAAQRRI